MNDYGNREIITSDGTTIHLNDLARAEAEVRAAEEGLEELCGGIREEIIAERRANLPEEQREALDTLPPERTQEQRDLAVQAANSLVVNFGDIADRAPTDVRNQALALAKRGLRNEMLADWVERYREIVNFTYWATRCEAEQEDNTISARRALLDALEAFAGADLEGAREKFEQAWDRWAVVFEQYPILLTDVEGEDVAESVIEYQKLLGQLDETFPPKDFKLMRLLEVYMENYEELAAAVEAAEMAEADDADEDQAESTSSSPENADDPPAMPRRLRRILLRMRRIPARRIQTWSNPRRKRQRRRLHHLLRTMIRPWTKGIRSPQLTMTTMETEKRTGKMKTMIKTKALLAVVVCLLARPLFAQESTVLEHLTIAGLDGSETDPATYENKVLLIVNVASKCGLTPQYAGLQGLHEKYADQGLAVLGFPCNQFGRQEPGDAGQIQEFCQTNYGVSFDMFSKIEVNVTRLASFTNSSPASRRSHRVLERSPGTLRSS